MGEWTIEAMQDSDWPAVREIYRQGIVTGDATFETDVPECAAWDAAPSAPLPADGSRWRARRRARGRMGGPSRRTVYAGVAEVSVYVAEALRGQGIGRRLLAALVAESEGQGIWTLQAGIFAENRASIALHQRLGFRMVDRRERIGRRDGRWRDTVLLERRSEEAGK